MDDRERVTHDRDVPSTTGPGATNRQSARDLAAHRRQTAALDALAAIELDQDPSTIRSS